MSAQENMTERKVFIGDAVVFNSRRIEKLEEAFKMSQNNTQNVESTVELQSQLKMLEDKYNKLQELVTKLEESVEAGQHVSLNITENDSD